VIRTIFNVKLKRQYKDKTFGIKSGQNLHLHGVCKPLSQAVVTDLFLFYLLPKGEANNSMPKRSIFPAFAKTSMNSSMANVTEFACLKI